MITFGIDTYQTTFPDWSKHHKTIGIPVKRVYEDGETLLPPSDEMKARVKEHESKLIPKHVSLYNVKTDERRVAVDYYLPLQNLEYKESTLSYYDVGASNTEQTTRMRLRFQLEYVTFFLDYHFKSSGSYAQTLHGLLDGIDAVETMIEDVLESEQSIDECGIERSEGAHYFIRVVGEACEISDIEIEKEELLNALVGIEIYAFDQKIV